MNLKKASWNIFQEFRAFISRGNAIDMAVGIILGISFGKVIDSLVNQIIMPPIGLLLGGVNFQYWQITLRKASGASPAIVLNFGMFISALIDFFIVSLAAFILLKIANRFYRRPLPNQRPCPECRMMIPQEAKRCGHCSVLLNKETIHKPEK
ncbi:MAG: hypothetical protein Tsb0015_07260 [Simkaniaceae bacterium]